jgi:UDPglucose 6-dehydrogenase
MKKVAMIGVGKLGQDCAEVMAHHYEVVGYDIEPRNPEFKMMSSIQEAVVDSDIIFIAAPTPHDPMYGGETPTSHLPNKNFDYSIVQNILREVNNYVNQTQLVVLISTVLPGTVRNELRPCITNARFIYNPYLIAMGTIKYDMVNPEMIIIGTEDGSVTGDAEELIDFYKPFMENDPRYVVGTWDEAESIKIFYNTFISTKLALVNMIQDVAEANGNINVDVVTKALADSNYRITGPAYMQAALGDGGACHPRDNIALRWLAEKLELGYDLFDSIMKAREVQAERMALRCLKNGKNVTIVGKAYKPKVPYTNGSASMLVGHYIEKHGGNVKYYDINTGDIDLHELWTDVYLIGYWEEYVEKIHFPPWTTVIDPYRKLQKEFCAAEILYYGDTRPKSRYQTVPAQLEVHVEQILEIYPDLNQIKDDLHIIYAGAHNSQNFLRRPFEDIIDEIRLALKSNKKKFLFDGNSEDFEQSIVNKIHRLAKFLEKDLDSSDFIYSCGASNIELEYKLLYNKHRYTAPIHVIGCNYFEYTSKKQNCIFEFSGDYIEKEKGKKFLCFNKLHREHRINLLEMMLQKNLIKDGYYSFEGEGNWLDETRLDISKYPNIWANRDLFPLRLNITEERNNPTNLIPDDLSYFTNSYFSVVTETVFYKNKQNSSSIFFSEKTYKPIICNHPFILVGRPGSLKKLREFGYKTFHPYIDEEYDQIKNDDERLNFIIDEIQRLCLIDTQQFLSWQSTIKPIVQHNKNTFFEKKNHNVTVNVLGTIMSTPDIKNIPTEEILEMKSSPSVIPKTTFVNVFQEEKEAWDVLGRSPPVVDEYGIYEIPNDKEYDNTMLEYHKDVKLSSGLFISFSHLLDGGGASCSEDIVNVIKQIKPEGYDNTLEWCSGMGAIGFDILGHKLSKRVVFQDKIPFAEDCIIKNAMNNDLLIAGKVKFVLANRIGGLPEREKFDLVVANPPHVSDYFEFLKNSQMQNSSFKAFLSSARMCVDHGYGAHKEFFMNIKKYLNDDADILLVENHENPMFKHWAYQNGLYFVDAYKLPIYENLIKGNMISARIMHFKLEKQL